MLARAATEHRPHARRQLPQAEWLGDVVVGADVEPGDAVAFARARRQHDDRNVRGVWARAQDSADFETAQHRQVQIQQDQIGLALRDDAQRGVAGLDDLHLDAADLFQCVLDQSGDVLLVLDDQHARPRASPGQAH